MLGVAFLSPWWWRWGRRRGESVTTPRRSQLSHSPTHRQIPFAESDRVDKPSNLYGSTKRFNEITALAYHNIYKLPSVGCRFFTVYGPWGRPDMAAFKFADKIEAGQTIKV